MFHDSGPICVVTVRAAHLRRNPGEVCFPGGRREPGDVDLVATALREAREEIGIQGAEVLGSLSTVPLYTSDHRLVPTVAAISSEPLAPDPGEVAAVIRIALAEVLRRPHIDAIAYAYGGMSYLSPVFPLGSDGPLMYGGTAHVFLELLRVLAPLWQRELPPLVPGRYAWSDVLPEAPT